MRKVEAIIRREKLHDATEALADAGFVGLNIVQVTGRGRQKGIVYMGRGGEAYTVDILPKVKIELVVRDTDVEKVIAIITRYAHTGHIGDGKIFVLPVQDAYRVRTSERGEQAL